MSSRVIVPPDDLFSLLPSSTPVYLCIHSYTSSSPFLPSVPPGQPFTLLSIALPFLIARLIPSNNLISVDTRLCSLMRLPSSYVEPLLTPPPPVPFTFSPS